MDVGNRLKSDDLSWEEKAVADREHEPDDHDLGNAKRFINDHGDDVIYVDDWKSYLVWDGVVYARDKTRRIDERARKTIEAIGQEALREVDPDRKRRMESHVKLSSRDSRRKGMLNWARHMLARTPEEFDTHTDLIATANCVVDLRTKEDLAPNRDYLMTRKTRAVYYPNTKFMDRPHWDTFIGQFSGGDEEFARWLQKVLESCIFGHNKEKAILFLVGPTRTGKTVLLRAIDHALGDLSAHLRPEVLLRQRVSSDRPDPEVAKLVGVRVVMAFETEEGQKLAEAKVKRMTGGDMISTRDLHQRSFDMDPSFTIILATNHKPEATTDPAVWDRIIPIPCMNQVPKGEEDKDLLDKLKEEPHGILEYLLDGAVMWVEDGGLEPYPKVVRQAISEYKTESNPLVDWMEDDTKDAPSERTSHKALYIDYKLHCDGNDRDAVKPQKFGRVMEDLGYKKVRGTGGAVYREGIILLPPGQRYIIEEEVTGLDR
jgi:putative DNA primase/helicase